MWEKCVHGLMVSGSSMFPKLVSLLSSTLYRLHVEQYSGSVNTNCGLSARLQTAVHENV